MKKYAFYDINNIVKQTFIAELNAENLSLFMIDYSKMFEAVGVQEYDPSDEIQIGWSVITHAPVEVVEQVTA